MKVGYIGLGAMGGTLARHLVATHELTVYDLNEKALGHFRELGAAIAETPIALLRESDVVVLCLPRSADVGELLFGTRGIAGHLRQGQLIIDQSSGSPDITATFARKLSSMGVLFMDAPVSGGIPAAQNRTVTVIASGSDEAWCLAEPVLNAISSKVLRCGEKVGDAQTLKLVTNGIGACYRLATLELVTLGRRYGLTLGTMVPSLNAGRGANFTTRNMLVGLLDGRSTTNFAMSLMVKDLNAALDLASSGRVAVPMLGSARGLMQAASMLFGSEAKLDDVVKLIETLTGTELAPTGLDHDDFLVAPMPSEQFVAALGNAVAACNVVAVLEGARIARAHGIDVRQLACVIEAGSSWSAIADEVLAVSAEAFLTHPNVIELRAALEEFANLASSGGSPFLTAASAVWAWRMSISVALND